MIPEREPERRLPGPRTTAGAKITGACIQGGSKETCKRCAGKECTVYRRTRLVPAPAVIPAPGVSMMIAAVKEFVVEPG